MIQEEQQDYKPTLLLQGDLDRGSSQEDPVVYKVLFSKSVEVQQIRIVRGGTTPHHGLRESNTQKGEEIEKLEFFARCKDQKRGFQLISSSEKISEKGNHDTIIPIDSNYTVYSLITADVHRSTHHPRQV